MIDCLPKTKFSERWRALFRGQEVDEETLTRAEALLEELRPESPLRHRLDGELNELAKDEEQEAAAPKEGRKGQLTARLIAGRAIQASVPPR